MISKKHLIFPILLLVSCGNKKERNVVYNSIETSFAKCNKDTCSFDFKENLNFDWDKVFVFKYSATTEDVNKQLGFKYPYYKEFTEKIIFVKNNSVVFHQDEPIVFEGVDPKGGGLLISFPFKDDENCFSFNKTNSKFATIKDENSEGQTCFYLLNPQ